MPGAHLFLVLVFAADMFSTRVASIITCCARTPGTRRLRFAGSPSLFELKVGEAGEAEGRQGEAVMESMLQV